ncbi:MAG: hypothetical protein ACE5I1_08185 [bacterium]
MKRSISIVTAALLILFVLLSVGNASEKSNKVDWKSYGKNLAWALQSDNLGLQRSALLTIIHKGDRIQLGKGIHNLMNIYLAHEDERFRQLALVALHKTRDDWAMYYLRGQYRDEKSPKLKRLMALILNDYFENT